MLKKRLIFTLLYDSGYFMLSRNFRLQQVGDSKWLKENYNFSTVSYSIDELIILDVTRQNRNLDQFCESLKEITKDCFVPISAGGGIKDINSAKKVLRSGADKIVINSNLFSKRRIHRELSRVFGQQCIVASIDVKMSNLNEYEVWSQNGNLREIGSARTLISQIAYEDIGEIYLNSIDRDGTGQGFDFGILELLPSKFDKPLILAGGAGNANHLILGLQDERVDAVATANLFNFIGDGLTKARESITNNGINLPLWDTSHLGDIRNKNIKTVK